MTTLRVFSKPRTRAQRKWTTGMPVKILGLGHAWIVVGYCADGRVALRRARRRVGDVVDPDGGRVAADPDKLAKRGVQRTPELLRPPRVEGGSVVTEEGRWYLHKPRVWRRRFGKVVATAAPDGWPGPKRPRGWVLTVHTVHHGGRSTEVARARRPKLGDAKRLGEVITWELLQQIEPRSSGPGRASGRRVVCRWPPRERKSNVAK